MSVQVTEKAFVLRDYSSRSSLPNIPEGYTLENWNYLPDGSGTTIALNVPYHPNNDVKLYAQWKKIEQNIKIVVYTWKNYLGTYDYSVTFTESNGEQYFINSAETNIKFKKIGEKGTMTIPNAPGIFMYPGNEAGEKLTLWTSATESSEYTYDHDYADLNHESTATKTFTFTIGEFKTLYIHKLPVSQTLTLDDKFHLKTGNYGDGGVLFGGHKYIVHWYDRYKFCTSGNGYTKVDLEVGDDGIYQYNQADRCFINIAHTGSATGHVMHAWLGYAEYIYDGSGKQIYYDHYISKKAYSIGDYVVNDVLFKDSYGNSSGIRYNIVFKCIQAIGDGTTMQPYVTTGWNRYWDPSVEYVPGETKTEGGIKKYAIMRAHDQITIERTGLHASTGAVEYGSDESNKSKLKNFHKSDTLDRTFAEYTIDLSAQPRSKKIYIGFGIQDNAGSCIGVKFRGTYKVRLA